MIGQFCGSYSTVRPAKFKLERFLLGAKIKRYNKYLTNLVSRSACTVNYGPLFFPFYESMGENEGRNLQHGPRTRLVRGIMIWQGKSERSDWFFLRRDFAIRTVSVETVQAVYFYVFDSRQI